jgi:hypothetical protein
MRLSGKAGWSVPVLKVVSCFLCLALMLCCSAMVSSRGCGVEAFGMLIGFYGWIKGLKG